MKELDAEKAECHCSCYYLKLRKVKIAQGFLEEEGNCESRRRKGRGVKNAERSFTLQFSSTSTYLAI
jgi:hypothetical protein